MTFCKILFYVQLFLYTLYKFIFLKIVHLQLATDLQLIYSLLCKLCNAMNANEIFQWLLIGKYLLAVLILVIMILMLFKFYKDYAVVDMNFCNATWHVSVLYYHPTAALHFLWCIQFYHHSGCDSMSSENHTTKNCYNIHV